MAFHDPVLPPKPPQPQKPTPVTVAGGSIVGSMSVTGSALPANAAKETGGNLDALTGALVTLLPQLLIAQDQTNALLKLILRQLNATGERWGSLPVSADEIRPN